MCNEFENKTVDIPIPTIRRIPYYLRLLYEYDKAGHEWISATDIGDVLNLNSIQVRKDLTFTNVIGRPKRDIWFRILLPLSKNSWAGTAGHLRFLSVPVHLQKLLLGLTVLSGMDLKLLRHLIMILKKQERI